MATTSWYVGRGSPAGPIAAGAPLGIAPSRTKPVFTFLLFDLKPQPLLFINKPRSDTSAVNLLPTCNMEKRIIQSPSSIPYLITSSVYKKPTPPATFLTRTPIPILSPTSARDNTSFVVSIPYQQLLPLLVSSWLPFPFSC